MSKISINPKALAERKEWKRHKIKEGSNFYRFLPPFGEASNGYPYRKWMIVWGLIDPQTQRMRPYASSLTTEQRCPIFEWVGLLQKKAEAKKSELKTAGYDEKTIKEMLKPLNKVISDYRLKTVYAWNAVDQSGQVGILELKATAHKALKKQMNQYISDYNQDPTSVNCERDDSGVWFNITREGEGFDTEYSAKKLQKQQRVDGQLVFIDDRSALPENIRVNWKELAYDLGSIYQKKTYDELREILMANMPAIINECPDAAIEGFIPNAAVPVVTPATVAIPAINTGKVNIKLNDEDDEPAHVNIAETRPNMSAADKQTKTDDDPFLAMADSILKD